MDFEIEGDDDDYNFDWGDNNKPAAKKNSMFGGDAGGYEDESEYNFSYENDRGSKKKYEPFSPQGVHHSNPVSKAAPQNTVVANSGNALERAQSLMDKYSGKSVSAAPSSNFRNQNLRTFSEADISMSSSEEEPSDFEMSESIDDTPVGKKGGKKDVKGKPSGKRDINALDSKAHVVVSMGESMDDDDYLSEQDDVAPPRSLKHAPAFDDVSEEQSQAEDENEYSNEEFDQDDVAESYEESAEEEIGESTHLSVTVDTEPDLSNRYTGNKAPVGVQFAVRNGSSANFPATNPTTPNTTSATSNPTNYTTSNPQSVFNSVRRASSPTYSDTSESTRPMSPEEEVDGEERADRSGLSDSPNENNASYSRLVYGNEDEHSSVSSAGSAEGSVSAMNATGGSRSSKPKVFSFADLLSQESFDADRVKSTAPTTTTITANNNNNNTTIDMNEVSELQDEFTHPTTTVVNTANTTSATSAVSNTTGAVSAVIQRAIAAANVNAASNNTTATANNTRTNSVVQPAVQLVPTRSDSPPTTTAATTKPTAANINTNTHAATHSATTAPAQVPSVQNPQYTHPPQAPPTHAPTHAAQGPPQAPLHYSPYPPYPTAYPAQPAAVDAQGQPLPVPPHALQAPYYPYPYPPPYYPPPYAYSPQYYPPYPYPAHAPHTLPHTQHAHSHSLPAHPMHAPHSTDPRFSMDAYNPLLHGNTPTLHTLDALSAPHNMRHSYNSHPNIHSTLHSTLQGSVNPRLSLSEANQVYGSAYFDRDVAQQPLVIDLLQELRKSKEEAAWAKNKLAETIVRLGQQQSLTPHTNNTITSATSTTTGITAGIASIVAGTATAVGRGSVGSGESKHDSPDRVKKHNAVSFLQDVISPVQPVRSSNNTTAATSAVGGVNRRLNDSSEEVQSEEEDSEGEGYSDYSDDFEQENNNNNTASANNNNSPTKGKKSTTTSSSTTNATASINNTATNNTAHTINANNTTSNTAHTTTAPSYSGPTLAEVRRAQEEAGRGLRERERVLDPLKESLAYSLLASQELFKNQLESLRARIGATNDYTNLMQQRVNAQWDTMNTGTTTGGSSSGIGGGSGLFGATSPAFEPASVSFLSTPSLHHLRSSFESRRAASSEKLLDLLTQVYPHMTVEEATRLAAKI